MIGNPVRAVNDSALDAALIRLTTSRSVKAGLRMGPITGILDPIPKAMLPLRVQVVGGCSGITEGFVDGTDFNGPIDYETGPITVHDHLHLIGVGMEISRPGDSGALVVEKSTRRVVGMVRAGEGPDESDYAIATPILNVLGKDGLHVSFL